MGFRDIINSLAVHPYYYVSPCPNCGSTMTGRIVKNRRDADIDWAIVTALRNGEIVVPVDDPGKENACCLECDHIWCEPIELTFITSEERKRQKSLRNTRSLLDEKSKVLKEEKMNEKGPFLGFRRYIGKW